jgi:hypothetical protein
MLAEIMTSAEFGEICFLIAVILFAIEVVVRIMRNEGYHYQWLLLAAGLFFLALGWLALPTGDDPADTARAVQALF